MTSRKWMGWMMTAVAGAAVSCSGAGRGDPAAAAAPTAPAANDDAAVYAPLDVGADWRTYTRMNREPVLSRTHGGRLVDTWVNAVGAAAYRSDDAPIPVGTVIVKTSMEVAAGVATGEAGPIFVMAKREPGFSPDHDDWYFAIHWAEPPDRWRTKVGGGPVYWRTPSSKADYCWQCHENYDRFLGGVPAEQRAD
jgi:hypothetical protein